MRNDFPIIGLSLFQLPEVLIITICVTGLYGNKCMGEEPSDRCVCVCVCVCVGGGGG